MCFDDKSNYDMVCSTIYHVPALYGLIWGTPMKLFDGLTGVGVKALKEGSIDELFPMMVKDQNIPVKFNFDVKVCKSKVFQ